MTLPPAKSGGKAKEVSKTPKFQIPFTRKNYIAFGIGLALLLLGYVCLGQGPWDSFLSLTLAPILLVLAYCVVFPYAILARERHKHSAVSSKPE